MITDSIKSFVEGVGHAFVATADAAGAPHLAAGRGVLVAAPNRLVSRPGFVRLL